jgi:KUP system potassium uptake protein
MTSAVAPVSATSEVRPSQALILTALGVVFGDIGTSPLYALRVSLVEFGEVSERAVFGVLSLITWALLLVVTLKYVLVIMRADNRGEGGILAVMAMTLRTRNGTPRIRGAIMLMGMIGVALFYGDAMITPAISVLSAVEGLKIATPVFEPYVVPISLGLLIALFAVQSQGTARVGASFGPIIIVWFVVLAVLGVIQIAGMPRILWALSPHHGIELFLISPWHAFGLLGAVFLAVTGAEALFADMGHFGRAPIRIGWLYLVLPALLLNYLGQGALVLSDPDALENPFFRLVPDWALLPMVALAAAATIIASQAVISGAFSVTRQAVQLGYLPRLTIRHTSEEEIGQIYVPAVNHFLLAAVVILVVGFRSSENLGYAYGIAVSGTMAVTTVLAYLCIGKVTGWRPAVVVPMFALFLVVDLAFFGANLLKFLQGGWLPLLVAFIIVAVMGTWWRGRRILAELRGRDALALDTFLAGLRPDRPQRVPGTAIFLTARLDQVPGALLHSLKHYKVLHERVVLMTVRTEDEPSVADEERLEVNDLGKGFYTISARFGFMEQPNVLRALALCRAEGLGFELMETSFFVGRETLRAARKSPMHRWRQRLFIILSNNALNPTSFFRIPPNRVIEVGGHVEV